ncbi:MAG: CapA family protein [Chloroflexota bacterium]
MDNVSLYAVGDVAAFREDPETMFTHTASILNQADILFFQNERHYTTHTTWLPDVSHTEVVPPQNAEVLRAVKWDVASFAGNHSMDLGFDALLDTCNVLKGMGIQVIGAGSNIEEARRPAIVERKGVKVGFLAYASVIRPGAAAGTAKPGLAPMRAWTSYNPVLSWNPGSEAEIHTWPNREDLAAMVEDIRKLRPRVDVLVLSMHWGLVRKPVVLAEYQPDMAHAAIDAGADIILGHHPHILKGIEAYKGKVIFYSISHFAFDCSGEVREEWARHRPEENAFRARFHQFGEQLDPEWQNSKFAYPADHRKSMIVKVAVSSKGIEKVSFLPVLINKEAQPVVMRQKDAAFGEIVEYLDRISKEAGLDASLSPEGDEVVVRTE